MKSVGIMIKEYRESRGITQSHVATKAGIPAQKLSRFETCTSKISADEFLNLCINGFGVKPQIFFDEQLSKNEN